jgi:hypothetical protein
MTIRSHDSYDAAATLRRGSGRITTPAAGVGCSGSETDTSSNTEFDTNATQPYAEIFPNPWTVLLSVDASEFTQWVGGIGVVACKYFRQF